MGTHVIKSIEEFLVNEGDASTDSPVQTDSSPSSAGEEKPLPDLQALLWDFQCKKGRFVQY